MSRLLRILFLVGLLLCAAAAQAQTFVQTAKNFVVSAGSLALPAFASSVGTNDLIACSANIFLNTSVTLSVSDNKGNTYSAAVGPTRSGSGASYIFYAVAATGGTNFIVTITASSSGSITAICADYSGMASTSPLDQVQAAIGTSATPSSGATPTTTQANELVFGGIYTRSVSVNVTAGSTFTLRDEQDNTNGETAAIEDKNVTSTGAQTCTATISSSTNWIAQCATFKAAGAVAVPPPRRIIITQVGPEWLGPPRSPRPGSGAGR